MNIGTVIQARMGSTRLPGKVLMFFNGETLLDHILNRVKLLNNKTKIIIVTTTHERDDLIESWCLQRKLICLEVMMLMF